MEGFILLHRKIQENPLWESNEPFDRRSAWIDLLMLANHADVKTIIDYDQVVIKRGQHLTSVRKLSTRWSWSKDRTLKYLRLLESLGMIKRESNNQRTLVTIVNYGIYQGEQDTKRTQNGHDLVHSADTGSPQTNNDNNDNNDNNKNNRAFVKPNVDEVKAYCLERGNSVDAESFINFYDSKGWMIGKNKMKDWKAAVRTWEKSRQNPKPETNKKVHNYNEREIDYAELEKIAKGG